MSLSQFDAAARAASLQLVRHTTEMITSAALQLFSDLQADAKAEGGGFGSPVASGRLASSMRLGVGEIDHSTAPEDTNYQYPAGTGPRQLPPRTIQNDAISATSARLRSFQLGDTIYISNSVAYIRKIEIGGHSWQTPDGIFGPTVRRFQQRFRNIKVGVTNG